MNSIYTGHVSVRQIFPLLLIVCSISVPGFAQSGAQATVVVTPKKPLSREMTDARLAYYQAFDDWKSSDPHLESEIFQGTTEQRQVRIERAQRKRHDVMVKKLEYLKSTSAYFQSLVDMVAAPDKSQLDAPAMKADAQKIERDLRSQKQQIDEELKALGNDTVSVLLKRTLESEKAALNDASDKLLARIDMIDEFKNSDSESSRKEMEASLRSIVDNLAKQKVDAAEFSDSWDRYYKKMLEASSRGPVAPAQPSSPSVSRAESGSKPDSSTAGKPSRPDAAAGNGAGLYAGSWVLSPTGSLKAGWPELTEATLNVREVGEQIEGTLKVTFDGEKGIATQILTLKGTRSPGTCLLKWSLGEASFASSDGLRTADEGTVELAPDEGTMIVSIATSSNLHLIPERMFGLNKAK